MITYTQETDWPKFRSEIEPLLESHWREIALDNAVIKLDPDWLEYARLDSLGQLHLLAVRNDDVLVGYYIGIVKPHLHYKSNLMAFNDVMYIKPEYRQGMVGVRIFKEIERTLKERGVEKMYTNTKAHHDFGVILDRLGYRKAETIYTKVIK
jgi:GNAT superfamily N-acetyltransferase